MYKIASLILAAGSSSRLGRPKQLLEINGQTLLQRAIASAREVSKDIVVVLGANENLIRPTLTDLPVDIVLNENWEVGMSTSIRTGISFLEKKTTDGALIMLCDQPFVNSNLLKKLRNYFIENKYPIVASEYEGKVGVPAIFDISLFEKLKKLQGKSGAKKLIMSHLDQTLKVVFEKGKFDIDTEEDWNTFQKL